MTRCPRAQHSCSSQHTEAEEALDVNSPETLFWEGVPQVLATLWVFLSPVTSCKLEMKPEERLESPKRFSMVVRLLLKLAL